MNERSLRIELGGGDSVSAVLRVPQETDHNRCELLALAHGAGTDMRSAFLSFICESVAAAGIATLKFNFPYKEKGRKAPDPAQKLEATWRSVLERLRSDPALDFASVFVGGKSLGGRMASRVVAQGEPVAGLVLLGYPLHPPGKPEKQRTEHFPDISVPSLFIQGTRDPLCDVALLREALPRIPGRVDLHLVEGGDHSFKVLKRTGGPQGQVWNDIVATVVEWISDRSRANPAER